MSECSILGLVARGGLQSPHHFLEQKKKCFIHNIGLDEREGADKKQQKTT